MGIAAGVAVTVFCLLMTVRGFIINEEGWRWGVGATVVAAFVTALLTLWRAR